MTTPEQHAEFQTLCEAVVEQQATPEQVARLEALFFSSAELRQQYIELAHLNASLATIGRHSGWQTIAEEEATTIPAPTSELSTHKPSSRTVVMWGSLVTLVLALSLLVAFLLVNGDSHPNHFAKITSLPGTKWESSTIPTVDQARFGAGRIRLAEGIATLTFDNGATVELEGPADFEITDPLNCRLHSGKLVATMSPNSKGFAVQTPEALLVDQGTSFGVSVAPDGRSTLQVFDGLVEVTHHQTGEELAVEESQAVEISPTRLTKLMQPNEASGSSSNRTSPGARRQSQITTAMGVGADHYVIRDPQFRDGPADLLMIKLSDERFSGYDRKIYLKFDLREVDLDSLTEATLTLTASPTDLGYSSRMPNTMFTVYALTNDQLDNWQPDSLSWETAPANTTAGDQLDTSLSKPIGTFQIPHGQKQGLFSVSSDALLDAIRSDANQLLTLVVVPETREVRAGALVHGFASGSHATLPAPTLRLIHQE